MTYRRAISRWRYLTSRHFYTRMDLDQAANQLGELSTEFGRRHGSIEEPLTEEKPCKAGSLNFRKVSGRLCISFFSRATHLRRSLPN